MEPIIGIEAISENETVSTSAGSEACWLYSTKLFVDSTLILMCEKQTSHQNIFQGPSTLFQVIKYLQKLHVFYHSITCLHVLNVNITYSQFYCACTF